MGYTPSQLLATLEQFQLSGLPAKSTENVSPAQKTQGLRSASGQVIAAFNSKLPLPLTEWGDDIVQLTCDLAAYIILKTRGFDPEKTDKAVWDSYVAARAILAGITAGTIVPVVKGTPTNAVGAAPRVFSYRPRGWYRQDFGRGGGGGVSIP